MCWFPVGTGRKAVFFFSTYCYFQKGDVAVILDLHGETDGWLLTVEMPVKSCQDYLKYTDEGWCKYRQRSPSRSQACKAWTLLLVL